MKVRIILVFALLAAISLDLYSQMDARQLPYFLDAQKSKMIPGMLMRGEKFVPAPDGDYDYNAKREDVLYSNDGIKLIKVTKESNAKSETHIAIDPNNPNVIIGTSNDSRYNHAGVGYRMGAYYTNDGGATWGNSTTPANMDLWIKRPTAAGSSMTIFDPSIDFDSKGNAYYLYGFTQIINSLDDGNNGVFISKSPDGGKTWESPFPVILAEGSSVPFHDRYWIAVDNQTNSPYKDNIYVSWQRFKQDDGIVFSWINSSNFGISDFSTPLKLGSNSTQSPMPAVGPDGEVYVAWQQRQGMKTDAVVRKSVNGGKSFSEAKTAQSIFTVGTVMSSSGRFVFADKQNMRASSYPAIAADCSNGPKRGYVYLVQTGKLAADAPAGVFLSVSKDGISWAPNQKIDENETLGRDVFFPAIDIDPISGMIAVLYYSSKDADNNSGVDAYIAISTDGGQSFKNTRLTSESFYIDNQYKVSYQGTGNYYWGDYTGVTIHNKKIYPLFWWPSNAQGYFNYLDCYSAILSPCPLPPANVTNNSNQSFIILNWQDPTNNQLGEALDNFKINIYRDGLRIGEVNKGVMTFTDNNIQANTGYHYQLETAVNDVLVSDKVDIYAIGGGNAKAQAPTGISFDYNPSGFVINWNNPETHVDGTPLWDFAAVDLYVNGSKVHSITSSPSLAGKAQYYQYNTEVGKFYRVELKAITARESLFVESDFSEKIIVYSGMPFSTFSENFDSENTYPYYTNSNWGKTNIAAASAPNSMTDSPSGTYEASSAADIVFGPFIITSSNKNFDFKHIAIIHSGDFGYLNFSKDKMKTWKTVKAFNINSYPELWNEDLTECTWAQEAVDLTQFIGDTIFINYTIHSNILTQKDGWFIDDLELNSNISSVNDLSPISNFKLSPNPVSETALFDVLMSKAGQTEISIYNSIGEMVSNLFSGYMDIKSYRFEINAGFLPSGSYFIVMNQNGNVSRPIPFVITK